MAKKYNKLDDGLSMESLDLDLSGDFGGLGDDTNLGGGKRSPVSHLSLNFARGAVSSFTNPRNITNAAKSALPEGYSTAINTGYEVVDLGRNLYHSAAEELRPAMPTIRRVTGAFANKTQRFLPKKVHDKLKGFADKKEGYAQQYDQDSETINAALAEMFGTMGEEQARQREEDHARSEVQAKIQDTRAVQSLNLGNATLKELQKLSSFQDNVHARVLKRSMELEFRRTFYMRDMLQLQMASERRQAKQLEGILRNTSLPEYAKTNMAEAAKASFRDSLLNNVQSSAVKYVTDFSRNLGDRLKGTTQSAMSQLAFAISMMGDTANETRDAVEMSGQGKGGFMANQAGNMLLPALTMLMGPRFRKMTEKNQKIADGGARMNYLFSNLAERANVFSQSSNDDSTLMGGMIRFIQNLIPRMGHDVNIASSPMYEADKATAFDKQTRRSIVEVIPGFLSRIHHEVHMLRTKNNDAERLVYNMERGEFTNFSVAVKDTQHRLYNPLQMQTAQNRIDEFMKHLDPQNMLDPAAHNELKRQITNDARSGQYFRPERYLDASYKDAAHLSDKTREQLRRATLGRYYDDQGRQNIQAINASSEQFKKIKNDMPDVTGVARTIDAAGGREYLNAINLTRRQGYEVQFNQDVHDEQLFSGRFDNMSPDLDGSAPRGPAPAPERPIINDADVKAWGRQTLRARARFNRGVRKIFTKKDELVDIYRNDGAGAVFDKVKLDAGAYVCEVTKRPIEKVEDIRGDIYDKTAGVRIYAAEVLEKFEANNPKTAEKLRAVKNRIQKTQRQGRVMWRSTKRAQRAITERGRQHYDELLAVYEEGGRGAVFEYAKLTTGFYRDAVTKKAIHKFEDIKGDVIDATGKMVATSEQIYSKWRTNNPESARKLDAVAKRMKIPASVRSQWKRARDGGAHLFTRGRSHVDTLKAKINEERARIQALVKDNPELSKIDVAKLVAGEYRDSATNMVINTIDDLKGTLVDKAGNPIASMKTWAAGVAGNVRDRASAAYSSIQSNWQRPEGDPNDILIRQGDRKIELLEGILDALENGDFSSAPSEEGGKRQRGAFKRGAQGLWRGLKRGGKMFGKYATTVWSAPFRAASWAKNAVGNLTHGLGNYLGDVYVDGGRLALTRVKMNNGDYVLTDDPKKTVRSIRDIRGSVTDTKGNPPNVVLTLEEYEKGLFDSRGNKIRKGLFGAVGAAAGMVGAMAKGYFGLMTMPFRAMSWVAGKLRDANAPRDVYIKREPNAPAVSVSEIRSEIVFKGDRKTLIRHPREIDGQTFKIVNGEMQECISLDDYRAGLVDASGKELKYGRNAVSTLFNGVTGAVGGLLRGVGSMYSGMGSMIGGAFRRIGSWLRPGGKREMNASDAQVMLLGQIYQLLDERIKKPRRIRKGSWEDQQNQKKAAAKEEREERAAQGEGGPGFFSKMAGLFGGLFGGDEDGEGGSNNFFGMPPGLRRAGRWLNNNKGGLAAGAALAGGGMLLENQYGEDSKLASAAGTAMEYGGYGLLASTLIPSRWKRAMGKRLGRTAAGQAAKRAGTTVATRAGSMLGRQALMTGARYAGGLILGAVSLPVALVAAGVAAAGYGIYKGFKKYKYGTYMPLRAFRMAQYGTPWNKSSDVEKLVDLEQLLEEHTRDIGGKFDIAGDKITFNDLYKIFGITDGWFTNNEEERAKFGDWFNVRFKPVYLAWVKNARAIKPGMRLNDADEALEKEQKLNLLRAANAVSGQAYGISIGPFDGNEIEITPDDVAQAFKEAMFSIDTGHDQSFMSKVRRWSNSANSLNPYGFMTTWASEFWEKRERRNGAADESARINALMAGKNGTKGNLGAAAGVGVTAALGSLTATPQKLTAIDAIRMRAYGLMDLTASRVTTLVALERFLMDEGLSIRSRHVQLNLPVQQVLERFGPQFGVSSNDSRATQLWTAWFENRFLPVLLAYCSAMVQMGVQTDEASQRRLEGPKLLRVAQAVIAATTAGFFFTTSVWKYTISPWMEDDGAEVLNPDADSTKDSMEALRKNRAEKQVEEERPRSGTKSNTNNPELHRAARNFAASTLAKTTEQANAGTKNTPAGQMSSGISSNVRNGIMAGLAGGSFAPQAGGSHTTGTGFGPPAANSASFNGVLAPNTGSGEPYRAPKLSGTAAQNELILLKAAMDAGITDPMELAAFMANCAHESGKFSTAIEDVRWSAATMRRLWPNRFASVEEAQALLNRGREHAVERIYGGRMGNDQYGDGMKYRGRGFLQITGKANYIAMKRRTGIDVVNNPDQVATDPKIAALASVDWWLNRGSDLRAAAQQGNITRTGVIVNGGTNGMADRRNQFSHYVNVIQQKMQEAQSKVGSTAVDRASITDSAFAAVQGGARGGALPAGGGTMEALNKNANEQVKPPSYVPQLPGAVTGTSPATSAPGIGVLRPNTTATPTGAVPSTPSGGSSITEAVPVAAPAAAAPVQDYVRTAQTVSNQGRQEQKVAAEKDAFMESLQQQQLDALKSIDGRLLQTVELLTTMSTQEVSAARQAKQQGSGRKAQTDNLSETALVSTRRNVAARA